MASYARRTCSVCGIILPQPQMRRKKVRRRVGEGNTGLSFRNIIGWVLGHSGADRRITNYLINPNKRVYTRNKQVWVCPECD